MVRPRGLGPGGCRGVSLRSPQAPGLAEGCVLVRACVCVGVCVCVCVCVSVRPSVCLSPASEKALLRDSSPASGTDRDSPEPLLKADPDHKELDSKSPDEIILEESDSEEGKKEGEAAPGAAGASVGAAAAVKI